jgi:hypothetical protein
VYTVYSLENSYFQIQVGPVNFKLMRLFPTEIHVNTRPVIDALALF